MSYEKDTIVTLSFENPNVSNTYLVYKDLGDTVLLYHPLSPNCLLEKSKEELNKNVPNVKDSTERCLDFAKANSQYFDYNTLAELEALALYYVFMRSLTFKQKQILSNICGKVAVIKFDNDLQEAMNFIKHNEGLLDDFNRMWYRNFKGLFSGNQPVTSKKQRASIFNISGFVLAQLANPVAAKGQ